MTGREVYTQALGFLMEMPTDDKVFMDNAVKLVNAGITELTAVQKSREAGYVPRYLGKLDEKISLDEELCAILPLYLASHFFRDDADRASADVFYSRFVQSKESLKRVKFADVEDVYGGEERAD